MKRGKATLRVHQPAARTPTLWECLVWYWQRYPLYVRVFGTEEAAERFAATVPDEADSGVLVRYQPSRGRHSLGHGNIA